MTGSADGRGRRGRSHDPLASHYKLTLQAPAFPLHLYPQDLLPGLLFGGNLEEVIPCLRPARAPPALSGGPALRPVQVLPSEAVTGLHKWR